MNKSHLLKIIDDAKSEALYSNENSEINNLFSEISLMFSDLNDELSTEDIGLFFKKISTLPSINKIDPSIVFLIERFLDNKLTSLIEEKVLF